MGKALQLADVARPAVLLQQADGVGLETDLAHAVHLRKIRSELPEQQIDISLSLPEGRDADLGRRKAEIKVFAELAPLHGLVQMYVGGGDHAYVRVLHLVGAHLTVLSALQHAEQERLGLQRELCDLVQKERTAVRLLEITLAVVHGPGEGSLHMAEQLRVNQFFGKRTAVYNKKVSLSAGAELVNDAGYVLLSHAAFSLNENA